MNELYDRWEYLRIAYERDGNAEPSFHPSTVFAYRFVSKTTVEQVYTLQGVFDCLDQSI